MSASQLIKDGRSQSSFNTMPQARLLVITIGIFQETNYFAIEGNFDVTIRLFWAYYCYLFTWIAEKIESN